VTHCAGACRSAGALSGEEGVSKTPPERSEKRICEGYKFQGKNSTSSCLHEAGKEGHWLEAFSLFSPAADDPKQKSTTAATRGGITLIRIGPCAKWANSHNSLKQHWARCILHEL